jgi:hypothetical protein
MSRRDAEMQELNRKFEAMEREYKERTRNLEAELEKNRADTNALQKALAREQETRMSVQRQVNKEFAKVHQKFSELRFEEKQLKEASAVPQMSKKQVGLPGAKASMVSVEPPNLQGIPVVEPNAGAAGPLESTSNGAVPGEAGKGEANGGGLRPEVRMEESSTQVETEIPIFVPLQSDKGNDVVVQITMGSVSVPVVSPTVSLHLSFLVVGRTSMQRWL